MRGEHTALQTYGGRLQGSSPHARGTQTVITKQSEKTGIIPACAGNTRTFESNVMVWRDHPRMRGEHALHVLNAVFHLGSSPHARGTPTVTPLCRLREGIIPACAGNTRELDIVCK